MKNIALILLALLPLLAAGQKEESEVRSTINSKLRTRILGNDGIKAANVRDALNDVVSYAAQRTPFMTMAQLRAGKADTARAVQITDAGREGWFLYVPGSVAPDDSAMTIRFGSRVYVRKIYNNIVNATDLGVIADFNPTDSTGTDNTYTLQKAINFCRANKYKLELPRGALGLSGKVIIGTGLTITGISGANAADQPATEIRALKTHTADCLVQIGSPDPNIFVHFFKMSHIRVKGSKSHGIIVYSTGELAELDMVSSNSNKLDGIYFKRQDNTGSGTPIKIGHISVHGNGRYGLNLEGTNQTHVQVLYLAGDNNGKALCNMESLNSTANVHIVGWKAERWAATYGHPVIFRVKNGNGAVVKIGPGRVHLAVPNGTPNGNTLVLQVADTLANVARVSMDNITLNSINASTYDYGYVDSTTNYTESLTNILRKEFHSVADYNIAGRHILTHSGNPEGLITAPIGSLCLVRNQGDNTGRIYIKRFGSTNTGWVQTSGKIVSCVVTNISGQAFAHGLPYTPQILSIMPKANLNAWSHQAPSSTNIYLTATETGTVDVLVY